MDLNIKQILLSNSRRTKQFILIVNDLFLFFLSYEIAISINQKEVFYPNFEQALMLVWIPILGVSILYVAGVYNSIVRYINFEGIYVLLKGLCVIVLVDLLALLFLKNTHPLYLSINENLVMQTWIIGWLFTLLLIVGSRFTAHAYFLDDIVESRVMIYGAGSAGIQLASALKHSSEMRPISFIDSNTSLQNTFVGGLRVLPPSKLEKIIKRKKVDEVLIAMPSASRSALQSLLKEIEQYSIKVRILPGVAELAQGKVLVSELKEVDISDLLGRMQVDADQELINKNITKKVVMVTGAGGSIGAEIARQVLKGNPEKLIILDANEFSLYFIKQELKDKKTEVKIESILGNVTNKLRIKHVCEAFGVQTIYHAAAYKHVPLVEENPFEGVVNNIFGTLNCVQAAIESEIETFVLISTDKAVRPTNIMGATKRFSELILQSLSHEHQEKVKTKITMVRFGNVLGSSGSAIPLFQQQIKTGGPVTVTDPEVIRYFMTVSEAAELVIQAGAMGKGGEVFVLNMGEPVKILELAKRMIRLSGMEIKDDQNPEGDIEIIFTGLRPGEKLYEELLIGNNIEATEHQQIFKANEDFIPWKELEEYLNLIKEAESSSDHIKLRDIFVQTVSGYKTERDVVDVIYLEKSKNS
jgi:FlaA1/EpsC-like NDP-sugar epimerase